MRRPSMLAPLAVGLTLLGLLLAVTVQAAAERHPFSPSAAFEAAAVDATQPSTAAGAPAGLAFPRAELSWPQPEGYAEALAARELEMQFQQSNSVPNGTWPYGDMIRIQRWASLGCSGPLAETNWMRTQLENTEQCQEMMTSDSRVWIKDQWLTGSTVTFRNCSFSYFGCDKCTGNGNITWALDTCIDDPVLHTSHWLSLVNVNHLASGIVTLHGSMEDGCVDKALSLGVYVSPEEPCRLVNSNLGHWIVYADPVNGWFSRAQCGNPSTCGQCELEEAPEVGSLDQCFDEGVGSYRVTFSAAESRFSAVAPTGLLGALLLLAVGLLVQRSSL